ncbi:hypothetical protein RB201_30840 [Streptomyces sp. S1A(2023)]
MPTDRRASFRPPPRRPTRHRCRCSSARRRRTCRLSAELAGPSDHDARDTRVPFDRLGQGSDTCAFSFVFAFAGTAAAAVVAGEPFPYDPVDRVVPVTSAVPEHPAVRFVDAVGALPFGAAGTAGRRFRQRTGPYAGRDRHAASLAAAHGPARRRRAPAR